jgi:hypothetical protein
MFGGTVNGGNTMPPNGGPIATITLPAGNYILFFSLLFNSPGSVLYANVNTVNSGGYFGYSIAGTGSSSPLSGTFSATPTTSTTYTIVITYNASPTFTTANSFYTAVRVG